MAFSFLYLAVRALLSALVRSRRSLHVKDIELLVLCHELEILRRQVARPKLSEPDRALLAAAACHLPRSSRAVLLVTPRTLLRWHQALVRRKWRQAPGLAWPSADASARLIERSVLTSTWSSSISSIRIEIARPAARTSSRPSFASAATFGSAARAQAVVGRT